eukprot:CAMPEP_0114314232 /NCGR_PEP_ID=MMETSP0059-20121206/21657_1 /TAXON_ID=36894 /ORGANISM="Pyramimonas parkeae, Strain CCMP726" /LENGTH=313 /DNA_ID=CAMNT_0001439277 /DNA_START=174 /DNA_END=1115 /DNA_ORIENTATION=-
MNALVAIKTPRAFLSGMKRGCTRATLLSTYRRSSFPADLWISQTGRERRMMCGIVAMAQNPKDRRAKRRSKQQSVNTSIPGNGLAELIAEKTGMPPALVQGAFLVAGASLVVSIGLSLIATLAVPALFTSLLALPAILALTGIVLAFGAVLGGLLPVLVVATGFGAASLFAGLILPALLAASMGMGLVWFLGAGKTQTEEANSSAGDQGVVDVEATEVQEPKQEEDEFAAWSQRELDEFDRKLMGDAPKWSVEEVGFWLEQNGFSELVEKFAYNGIDGKTLLTLGAEELRTELGMDKLVQRRELASKIDRLKK